MSLKCCACTEIKVLDAFSINQKKKESSPRCKDCVAANRDVVTLLVDHGNSGSHLRCSSCKTRKGMEMFEGNSHFCKEEHCKEKQTRRNADKARRNADEANERARNPLAGACRVKDVQRRYGHLCEIPLEAYGEAGVASSWNDYVTESDVEWASRSWDARSIAHDIDTQWGAMPHGGAYSDSNYYYGPGEYDYY